jgi:hypothetical protein
MGKTVINNNRSSGVTAIGLLGVLFVALKLLKVINWSWFWVLAPFWGGIVLVIVILIAIVIVSIFMK